MTQSGKLRMASATSKPPSKPVQARNRRSSTYILYVQNFIFVKGSYKNVINIAFIKHIRKAIPVPVQARPQGFPRQTAGVWSCDEKSAFPKAPPANLPARPPSAVLLLISAISLSWPYIYPAHNFFPFARPISTFTRLPLKYTFRGTSVYPFSAILLSSLLISYRCSSSRFTRRGSLLKIFPFS